MEHAISVALCDDEQIYLHDLKRVLEEYCAARALRPFAVSAFSRPFDLVEALERGQDFRFFLLDVYMPGMSGMEIARLLRKSGRHAPVVFLTTSRDHALEAFGVRATQYLIKPVEREALFAALDEVMERIGGEKPPRLVLKVGGEYRSLTAQDILYAESDGNYEKLHMTNGEILSVRSSSQELFEQLSSYGCFSRCGKAYILNLAHVKRINPKSAEISGGGEISVPRAAYAQLKAEYFEYYSRWED